MATVSWLLIRTTEWQYSGDLRNSWLRPELLINLDRTETPVRNESKYSRTLKGLKDILPIIGTFSFTISVIISAGVFY